MEWLKQGFYLKPMINFKLQHYQKIYPCRAFRENDSLMYDNLKGLMQFKSMKINDLDETI